MKFTISNQRALYGNDIDLLAEAEANETILAVTCSLDGFEIGSDHLEQTPVVSFRRIFPKAGEARTGLTHKFLVAVRVGEGNSSRYAAHIWTDVA